MLSGRVPFQGSQTDGTMMAVIKKIKGGSFNLSGEEWQSVSHSARELIKGLLTVDAAKRLSLTQVKNAEWIMSADVPHTPLMTPGMSEVPKIPFVCQMSYLVTNEFLVLCFDIVTLL